MKANGWDTYTAAVKPRNARWASTDRGWLFVDGHAVGNYLDYTPFRTPEQIAANGGAIHAVLTNKPGSGAWLPTVEDAQKYIETHYAAA